MTRTVSDQYRKYRQHQMATFGGSVTNDPCSPAEGMSAHQQTGGGAAYGFHAVSAYNMARAHRHFVRRHGRAVRQPAA